MRELIRITDSNFTQEDMRRMLEGRPVIHPDTTEIIGTVTDITFRHNDSNIISTIYYIRKRDGSRDDIDYCSGQKIDREGLFYCCSGNQGRIRILKGCYDCKHDCKKEEECEFFEEETK